MTMTSVRLAGSLQTLIDSRLDTIERMLMGRVPRQDRLAIVKDVETQIFDVLQEGGTDEPTREDILAALARLDPPEAYLPEDGEVGEAAAVSAPRLATGRIIAAPSNRPENSKVGKISGILGLATLLLATLAPTRCLPGSHSHPVGNNLLRPELRNTCLDLLLRFGRIGPGNCLPLSRRLVDPGGSFAARSRSSIRSQWRLSYRSLDSRSATTPGTYVVRVTPIPMVRRGSPTPPKPPTEGLREDRGLTPPARQERTLDLLDAPVREIAISGRSGYDGQRERRIKKTTALDDDFGEMIDVD